MRPDLYRVLIGAAGREGVRVRYGTTLAGLEQEGQRVAVTFADGSSAYYDLVVAFDGIGSEIRRRLFGDRHGLLRERPGEFEGTIGTIRDGLPDDAEVVCSPLSEVLLPAPWHKGRVVLGGDAAHACVPHLNEVAAMAIEDAATLADELVAGDEVEAALDAYSVRRFPRVKFAQKASRDVLEVEQQIRGGSLEEILAEMSFHLPEQAGKVDEIFDRAA